MAASTQVVRDVLVGSERVTQHPPSTIPRVIDLFQRESESWEGGMGRDFSTRWTGTGEKCECSARDGVVISANGQQWIVSGPSGFGQAMESDVALHSCGTLFDARVGQSPLVVGTGGDLRDAKRGSWFVLEHDERLARRLPSRYRASRERHLRDRIAGANEVQLANAETIPSVLPMQRMWQFSLRNVGMCRI